MKGIWVIGVRMVGLWGMWSCGKKVGEDIMEGEGMEKVVYDYDVGSRMSNDLG